MGSPRPTSPAVRRPAAGRTLAPTRATPQRPHTPAPPHSAGRNARGHPVSDVPRIFRRPRHHPRLKAPHAYSDDLGTCAASDIPGASDVQAHQPRRPSHPGVPATQSRRPSDPRHLRRPAALDSSFQPPATQTPPPPQTPQAPQKSKHPSLGIPATQAPQTSSHPRLAAPATQPPRNLRRPSRLSEPSQPVPCQVPQSRTVRIPAVRIPCAKSVTRATVFAHGN
jgi:hypothetical protein